MSTLIQENCQPLAKGNALSNTQIQDLLQQVSGWQYNEAADVIEKTFPFKNYDETVAFVNQVVVLVAKEDHHPDITFGFKRCLIQFQTHSVDGISRNDFICAAKINQMMD